jgi:hypothetical protein
MLEAAGSSPGRLQRLRDLGLQLPDATTEAILAVWQPAAQRPLTSSDAREIVANLHGMMRLLGEWAEQDRLDGVIQSESDLTAFSQGAASHRHA